MQTVAEIQMAIERLSAAEFAELLAWIEDRGLAASCTVSSPSDADERQGGEGKSKSRGPL
jgi:hypothetical protein